MVEHVNVQFTLSRQTCHRQVAAAQVPDNRIDRVGSKQQVELGMKGVSKMRLDNDLLGLDLSERGQDNRRGFRKS